MHTPRPFTYYRNDKDRRAFLVADVEMPGFLDNGAGRVLLMEWGKEGGKWMPYGDFLHYVEKGILKQFTPHYNAHALPKQ